MAVHDERDMSEKRAMDGNEISHHGAFETDSDLEFEKELNVTKDDLLEAKAQAENLSLEETKTMLSKAYKIHKMDPNFPIGALQKIEAFLLNESVWENPEKHNSLIWEMKIEAALISNNSPYAEVRAVVDPTDNPLTPSSTIRSWFIGLIFSFILPFVNQLFSERWPAIWLPPNVAQLLGFPIGKLMEKTLPDIGFTLWGIRHSLNPGPFNKKEHMLITIMANVAYSTPYTGYIILTQYLPTFYNQKWAGESFSYQILMSLSTNYLGYGMAGLCRRFLVYPAYCVWPISLVTVALNTALHREKPSTVAGPFKRMYSMSRMKFFYFAFASMFVYFWLPNFIWPSLVTFSWIAWISPGNADLVTVTGSNNGLGLNPFPTWDWNIISTVGLDPLMYPYYSVLSYFLGAFITMFGVLGMYYSNALNTGYIPINSNHVWDNTGEEYDTLRIVDDKSLFNATAYEEYSPPFLTAGSITVYTCFFGLYTATITNAALYHRHEIYLAFRSFIDSLPWRRRAMDLAVEDRDDIHRRLMRKYKEAPEWWYTIVMVVSIGLGCAGIAAFETHTSPFVVFYGLILCGVFMVPIGIVYAITGLEPTLNVLAEFIGGSIAEGNMLAMNYFKTYGYIVCAHALRFAHDLKLGHYLKIPPRQTFAAQMVATFISTFVCVGVMNFQIRHIPNICTEEAPWRMICPGTWTFYTASVLWGTIGPKKIWGVGGQYSVTLIGFPLGVVVTLVLYYATKMLPKQTWLRQIHPVILFMGGLVWAPYNLSFIWPSVPIAWLSWIYVKRRYLSFWSKYNYVLSAAFSCGIAISAIIMFWCVQYPGYEMPEWWGVTVSEQGCEGEVCVNRHLGKDEDYFGPRIGTFG